MTLIPEGGTPAWAASVNAFASAQTSNAAVITANQLQFPDTSQLGGLCGSLVGGSSFTSGLVANGDTTTGTAAALVSGAQNFADTMCGMAGGTGTNTTPQAVTAGAQSISDAVNASPMASGTIAIGQNGGGTNNTALDAINGATSVANTLFGILSGCGCSGNSSPTVATPEGVITTAQNTASAVQSSPMASGILAMGQDPTGSGNVAIDAVNGGQSFANSLMGILDICGCGSTGTGEVAPRTLRRLPNGRLTLSATPYRTSNVSPQTILNVAQATADAVSGNPFANDLMGGGSGNVAIDALTSGQSLVNNVHTAISSTLSTGSTISDVVTAGSGAIGANTSNHVSAKSLTPAAAVNLVNQNLLVSNNFGSAITIAAGGAWSWNGTTGDPSTGNLGCAQCVPNGTLTELVSSEIPVVAGETIEITCTVNWASLTYTGGAPIILGIEKYARSLAPNGVGTTFVDVGGYDVASFSPATSSSAAGVWTGLAGIYVVEPNVDQVRVRFKVGANATSGTILWDNAELLKTDLISEYCVPWTGQTVDNIVTQLYGTAGAGFTQNDAATALNNTHQSLTSLAARISALEAEGYTGNLAADDFNWSGEVTTSANWGGAYTILDSDLLNPQGVYTAAGTDATWNKAPGWSEKCIFQWEGADPTSTTDYQLIQVVIDSAPTTDTGYLSSIKLAGRMASAQASYTYAEIRSDGVWFISYHTGGVDYTLTAGTFPVPGAGTTISFYIGDKGTATLRKYTLMVNNTTIATFTEGGTGSPLGASNRGWGWGAVAGGGGWIYGAIPPAVHQWIGADQ